MNAYVYAVWYTDRCIEHNKNSEMFIIILIVRPN